MNKISNTVYCDSSLEKVEFQNRYLPNPYKEYPYLIIPHFFQQTICQALLKSIQNSANSKKAEVKAEPFGGVTRPKVIEKYRKTQIHKLPREFCDIYEKQFWFYQKEIEEFFRLNLTLSTSVQALEYTPGSFYIKHADDSNEIKNKDGNTVAYHTVSPERKITTVLFVSEHVQYCDNSKETFCGGELVFNHLYDKNGNNIILKPKMGDLVVFPSNPYFAHEVLTVKKGYRLTLVQWHNALINQ